MLWNIDELYKRPKVYEVDGIKFQGVSGVFFRGPDFKGKETRVFAWIGFPENSGNKKVPAVVLVHGGGGTAFAQWVRLWNQRGYAAIAVSTTGKPGIETAGEEEKNVKPHQWAGPLEKDKFELTNLEPENQWVYHGVADVILAHSLICSYPQVDKNRTAITGISWGGFLTLIASTVDKRFKCAAPTYGCGFINEGSTTFADKGQPMNRRWLELWDPSVYLSYNETPLFWTAGTNDICYPLDILEKSYSLIKGDLTLRIELEMPHCHTVPWQREEIYVFVDSHLTGTDALACIKSAEYSDNTVTVTFDSTCPIKKAQLIFTCDSNKNWAKRKWQSKDIQLNESGVIGVSPPQDAVLCLVNLIDNRNLMVSSRLIHLT